MEQQKAIDFFSQFYGGEHHIPRSGITKWGNGWMVKHDRGELATYDFTELTRLVLMAHERCYRVGVAPHNTNTLKICIWERQREGGMCDRHPTIEQAIEIFNKK